MWNAIQLLSTCVLTLIHTYNLHRLVHLVMTIDLTLTASSSNKAAGSENVMVLTRCHINVSLALPRYIQKGTRMVKSVSADASRNLPHVHHHLRIIQ